MPHINGCDWGHSVVTGSLKSLGVYVGLQNFSALITGSVVQSRVKGALHVHPMVPQVSSSSAAHALLKSILY